MTHMQLGQHWLIIYDNRVERANDRIIVAASLRWPDDTVLALYRRHLMWMSHPNHQQAMSEMRAALLAPDAPLASRVAAQWGLGWRRFARQEPGSDVALMQRVRLELLAQPNLPRILRLAALGGLHVDPTNDIIHGSEDDRVLRYLLNVLAKETDEEILGKAASRLASIGRQSVSDSKTDTAYHFPEILEALEKRAAQEDEAPHPIGYRGNPVSGAADQLRRAMQNDTVVVPGALPSNVKVVVIRRLP